MTSPEGAKGAKPVEPDLTPDTVPKSPEVSSGAPTQESDPGAEGTTDSAKDMTDQPKGRAAGPRADRPKRAGQTGPKARLEGDQTPGARRAARLAAARNAEDAAERVSTQARARSEDNGRTDAKGPADRTRGPGNVQGAASQNKEMKKPGAGPASGPAPGAAQARAARAERTGGPNQGAQRARNPNTGGPRPAGPAANVPVPVKGDPVPAKLAGGAGVPSTEVNPRQAPNADRGKAPVPPAKVRRRHRFMILSFVLFVILPVAGMFYYLFEHAQDRYASTAAFFVHREDTTTSVESVFGLAGVGGSGGTPDADVLYQFIQSQQMVELADGRLDLRSMYTPPFDIDPYFALNPEATLEDRVDYWDRVVSMVFAPDSGLITLEVIAYDPQDAQALAKVILEECANLIDRLSQIAQEDAIAQAQDDLSIAQERLKSARIAIAQFRSDTDFVDPSAGVAGAEGLITALQQELAAELINRDTLIGTTTREDDPRIERADRKIASIRLRIEEERDKVGSDQATNVGAYEELLVNRQFAEQSYTAALAAYDAAVAEARRKSRYLAVHIEPTLADTAVYPRRVTLGLVGSAFIFMAWAIFMLVLYSFHDRR